MTKHYFGISDNQLCLQLQPCCSVKWISCIEFETKAEAHQVRLDRRHAYRLGGFYSGKRGEAALPAMLQGSHDIDRQCFCPVAFV